MCDCSLLFVCTASQHNQHFSNLIEQVRQQRASKLRGSAEATARTSATATDANPLPPGATPAAAKPVRESPRSVKTRSSPRNQPSAKRRRPVKRSLPLSEDEEPTASGTDTDVDAGEFLASCKNLPGRRSTRKRSVKQSYIDASSSENESSQLSNHSSSAPRQASRRRASRAILDSSQEASTEQSMLNDEMTSNHIQVNAEATHQDTAQRSGSGETVEGDTGCASDTTAEYNETESAAEREELCQLDSQPLFTRASSKPTQDQSMSCDNSVPADSIPPPLTPRLSSTLSVSNPSKSYGGDDAETQYITEDDSTPNSSFAQPTDHTQVSASNGSSCVDAFFALSSGTSAVSPMSVYLILNGKPLTEVLSIKFDGRLCRAVFKFGRLF